MKFDFTEITRWFQNNIDFPAVVLLIILMMGAYILWKVQSNPDNKFDFADMLRDDSGKPSAYKMAVFVCLAVSSWAIMYILISLKGHIDNWQLLGYTAIWSGAKIVEKALDVWGQRGGVIPPQQWVQQQGMQPVVPPNAPPPNQQT